MRREVPDHADGDPPNRRPPHPVNRQVLEAVLDPVDGARDVDGEVADERADDGVRRQRLAGRPRQQRHGEDRRGAGIEHAHRGGDGARQRDGDDRARAELEEEKLDGQEHRGDGTAEGRRHTGGGAGREQRLALGRGGLDDLPEERAERAAGGDDRPFRAERAAGADGDRGREWLEERDARRDAALVEQHLLHGLGDAMAADGLRSVARHDADDDAADDRDDHDELAEVVLRRRNEGERPLAVKSEIRDEADQTREHLRDQPAQDSKYNGHHREKNKRVMRCRRRDVD